MKQYVFLRGLLALLCCALLPRGGSAQYMYNSGFVLNCGTNAINPGPCRTFSSTCVPNWGRSHGSARLEFTTAGTSTTAVPYFYAVKLHAANNQGQGIYGGYPFCPGVTYKISIRFAYGAFETHYVSGHRNHMYVRACNGLTTNDISPACTEPEPSVPGSVLLADVTTTSTFSSPYVYTCYFTNTTSSMYTQLMISHYSDLTDAESEDFSYEGHQIIVSDLGIARVCVERVCDDYTISSNPPPNIYNEHDHIYAGSSLGTTSTMVSVTSPTEFRAASSVVLERNFDASPSPNGGYFLAEIEPCKEIDVCGYNGLYDLKSSHCDVGKAPTAVHFGTDAAGGIAIIAQEGEGHSASTANEPATKAIADVRVYPNPAQDELNIGYHGLQAGTMAMEITDVRGQTVLAQEYTIATDGTLRVSLAGLASGVYFVRLSTADRTVVHKVTKM